MNSIAHSIRSISSSVLLLLAISAHAATVTVTVVTPVPIVLSGIQRPFGTQFVFSYSANVGLRYAVERSATLSDWTTIRSDTANVNPMTVTDTAATNRMNFYRVKRLPNP